jgi:glyoxylase-like metal-dependent hydrolase (beta-lactamase superfamily II)
VRIATIITTINNTDNLIVRGVPVTSTIVEFNDRTLAIIDTGMADNKPSDFSFVLNTHLHPDHIGGNRHFTNARIFISRKELAYHQSLEGACHASGPTPDIPQNVLIREMLEMRERYPVVELIGTPCQIEFLEDHPRLPWDTKLILAPGHSIDDHAVFLQGSIQNVLVAGDALYHRDLWREPSLPDIHLSEGLFRRSAQSLSEFQGIIVPGHDFAFDNATRAYLEANKFIPI